MLAFKDEVLFVVSSTATAVSMPNGDLEALVAGRRRRRRRRSWRSSPFDAMVNVAVMGDDLLDDRRPDFGLWRRRRRGEWCRCRAWGTLLPASDDDLVFDHIARWRWWGRR
jgi:hypothetical protein